MNIFYQLYYWPVHGLATKLIYIRKNRRQYLYATLKGLAQAKIIKKSVILFWLLNMTIWCKHVHRLELQKFSNFCAAHSQVRLDIETRTMSKIRNTGISSLDYSQQDQSSTSKTFSDAPEGIDYILGICLRVAACCRGSIETAANFNERFH